MLYSPLTHTSDLMWSDPEDIDTWAVSPRGAGWLFGGNVTREVHNDFSRTLPSELTSDHASSTTQMT